MLGKAHILVVDDEPAICFFLSEELAAAGYTVLTAASGEQALVRLQEEAIDLVLLDLRMTGMGGLQVLEQVHEQFPSLVVIILTAHATIDSAIAALRQGAADYLLKPCTSQELLASVAQGLARRAQDLRQQVLVRLIEQSAQQLRTVDRPGPAGPQLATAPRFLEAEGLLLDRAHLVVTRQGVPLELTPTEFKLLVCLMEKAGRPLSFAEIFWSLHGQSEDEVAARQALSTHLWRLRQKLGRAPDGGDYIVNVRGRGYKFAAR